MEDVAWPPRRLASARRYDGGGGGGWWWMVVLVLQRSFAKHQPYQIFVMELTKEMIEEERFSRNTTLLKMTPVPFTGRSSLSVCP
jgi:hypothetical protein